MDEAHLKLLDNLFMAHRDVLGRYRRWLSYFPKSHADRWEQRLRADPEAGLVESGVWDVLRRQLDLVQPNEDPSSGGPDFLCTREGRSFYVEATSLSIDSVTRESSLACYTEGGRRSSYRSYGGLTRMFRNEVSNKSWQCAKVKDHPCLVAIGTMHFQASCLCFTQQFAQMAVTSATMITAEFDPKRGEAVGDFYLTTDLRHSSFLKKGKSPERLIDPTRQVISAVLLCGLGCYPPNVFGVLHNEALRPFDRQLLPSIEFCRVRDGYNEGSIGVEWV